MNSFKYLFKNSLKEIWRRKNQFLPALLTLFLCVWLLQGVFFGVEILKQDTLFASQTWEDEWQIEVFFENQEKPDSLAWVMALKQSQKWEWVAQINPEQAWQSFASQYGNEMLRSLDQNPLPYSIRLRLKPEWRKPEILTEEIKTIQKMEKVESIFSERDVIDAASTWKNQAYQVSLCVALFLLFVLWLILKNTLTLSFLSRSDEIKTMRMIGASQFMLFFPFMIEAFLLALLSSAISIASWIFLYAQITIQFPWLKGQWYPLELSSILSFIVIFTFALWGAWRSVGKIIARIQNES